MARINAKIDLAEKEFVKHCDSIDKEMDLDIVKEKERHTTKLVAIEKEGETSKNTLMDTLADDIFKSLSTGK